MGLALSASLVKGWVDNPAGFRTSPDGHVFPVTSADAAAHPVKDPAKHAEIVAKIISHTTGERGGDAGKHLAHFVELHKDAARDFTSAEEFTKHLAEKAGISDETHAGTMQELRKHVGKLGAVSDAYGEFALKSEHNRAVKEARDNLNVLHSKLLKTGEDRPGDFVPDGISVAVQVPTAYGPHTLQFYRDDAANKLWAVRKSEDGSSTRVNSLKTTPKSLEAFQNAVNTAQHATWDLGSTSTTSVHIPGPSPFIPDSKPTLPPMPEPEATPRKLGTGTRPYSFLAPRHASYNYGSVVDIDGAPYRMLTTDYGSFTDEGATFGYRRTEGRKISGMARAMTAEEYEKYAATGAERARIDAARSHIKTLHHQILTQGQSSEKPSDIRGQRLVVNTADGHKLEFVVSKENSRIYAVSHGTSDDFRTVVGSIPYTPADEKTIRETAALSEKLRPHREAGLPVLPWSEVTAAQNAQASQESQARPAQAASDMSTPAPTPATLTQSPTSVPVPTPEARHASVTSKLEALGLTVDRAAAPDPTQQSRFARISDPAIPGVTWGLLDGFNLQRNGDIPPTRPTPRRGIKSSTPCIKRLWKVRIPRPPTPTEPLPPATQSIGARC